MASPGHTGIYLFVGYLLRWTETSTTQRPGFKSQSNYCYSHPIIFDSARASSVYWNSVLHRLQAVVISIKVALPDIPEKNS